VEGSTISLVVASPSTGVGHWGRTRAVCSTLVKKVAIDRASRLGRELSIPCFNSSGVFMKTATHCNALCLLSDLDNSNPVVLLLLTARFIPRKLL
jgi:hypothetical protein